MKDVDEYGQHWNAVPNAEYIISLEENVTVLCEAHMNAMRLACEAAGVPVEIYKIQADLENPDEEPVVCQACHLVEVKRPKIVLH
jgi:hypothetical protein